MANFERIYNDDGSFFDDAGNLIPRIARLDRDGNYEEKYAESVKNGAANFGYLALEIGKWASFTYSPKRPPNWVLNACLELYSAAVKSSRPMVGTGKGPKSVKGDDQKLDTAADIFEDEDIMRAHGFEKEPSVRAIFRHLLQLSPRDDDDANVRRLQRLWKADREHRYTQAKLRYVRKMKKLGLWKVSD